MRWADATWKRVAVDFGLVVALVVISVFITGDGDRAEPIPYLIVLLPLALRRVWPFTVFVVIALSVVVTASQLPTPWIQIAAVTIASFTTGQLAEDRTRSALGVVAVAGVMALAFLVQEVDPVLAIVLPFVIVVPSWLFGDIVRTRQVEAREREEQAARHLREVEARAEAAAAEERRHMARELHDIVAHGVSVMVVQAGAARQVIDMAPDKATDSLLTIESTGRDVMTELRRLLGVLNDEGEASGLAPQPGIDQLGPLVERVRQAGLPTELEVDGTPRTLPPSLDVTAYRIIQEALTNALRYARQARTLVHVSYEPAQVRVEVLDDGPTETAASDGSSDGAGRGLVGMRQRAAQVGGRLEAGPRLGGGYAVRAWLPVEPELDRS
jgi:signal transduction histidine kinase